jgi:hypothetical protein
MRSSPNPIIKIINMNPIAIPNLCGMLRQKPWFIPEDKSIILLGSDVMEITKAKSAQANKNDGVLLKLLPYDCPNFFN